MAYDDWPINVLAPKDTPNWWPSGDANSGGASVSGIVQLDRLDGGPMWKAIFAQMPVRTRTQVLALQAMQMILQGGATPIILPRMPGQRVPSDNPAGLVQHSDGTPFYDQSLYEGPTIAAVLAAGADLGAEEITFTITNGLPLMGGEDFSFNHGLLGPGWRLYRVKRILEKIGDQYTVNIGPGLRADVDAATALEFENPRCMMRLTNSDSFCSALQFDCLAYVDAEFEEAFF